MRWDPGMTNDQVMGSHTQKEINNNKSIWIHKQLPESEKRLILAKAIEIAVNTLFEEFIYILLTSSYTSNKRGHQLVLGLHVQQHQHNCSWNMYLKRN